jgi:hypothetical protein
MMETSLLFTAEDIGTAEKFYEIKLSNDVKTENVFY